MLGYPPTPPPPRGARRLTTRPADPLGLGQRRGWGGGSTTPEMVEHPSGSNPGWEQPRGVSTIIRKLLVIKGSHILTHASLRCLAKGNGFSFHA